MIGIEDINIYIPKYRVTNGKSEKSVCNFDEDCITMSIATATSMQIEQNSINSFYYTTCTPTYLEKQESSIIASVLGINESCSTTDISKSLRASVDAIIQATKDVKLCKDSKSIIISADNRTVEVTSVLDYKIGAGAASIIIGDSDNPMFELLAFDTIYNDSFNSWKMTDQVNTQFGDNRYSRDYDYVKNISRCLESLIQKNNIDLNRIQKILLPVFDKRIVDGLVEKLSIDKSKFIVSDSKLGFCGTPQPLIDLYFESETLYEGDEIIMIAFGDGCSAVHMKVGHIQYAKIKSEIERLENTVHLDFEHYLKKIKALRSENVESLNPYTSTIVINREAEMNKKLMLQKCNECGTFHFPHRNICWKCKGKNKFTYHESSKTGKVFTFTKGYLFPTIDDSTTMAIVDLDGGGRLAMMMTELDGRTLKVGDSVDLVYRFMYDNKGFRNYYWKAIKEVE